MSRLCLPDDDSPAVENVLSTSADDPGIVSSIIAITESWG